MCLADCIFFIIIFFYCNCYIFIFLQTLICSIYFSWFMNIGAVFMDPAAATAAGATKIASGCKRVEFFFENVKKYFIWLLKLFMSNP